MSLTAENKAKYLRMYLKSNAEIRGERLGHGLHACAAVFLSMLPFPKHIKSAAMEMLHV